MNTSIFFNIPSCPLLADYFRIASKIEYETEKPGNVSPKKTVKGVSVKDYSRLNKRLHTKLLSICASGKSLKIGKFVLLAVNQMMKTPPHQNLLLGYYLLCAPIFTTALQIGLKKRKCKQKRISWNDFWKQCKVYVDNSPVSSTICIACAINASNPGGLKNPGGKKLETEYDLTMDGIEENIHRDQLKLKEFFAESAHFDAISQEITTNYEYIRNLVQRWAIPNIAKYSTISDFVQSLFIKILSEKPDSLIYRKNNQKTAEEIQQKAIEIVKWGGYGSPTGREKIRKLNKQMMKKRGKLNPGTTADLTGGVLFVCLLFKIIPSNMIRDEN